MAYTQITKRNENAYFYRAVSLRNKNKILKTRIYLGKNLTKETLAEKELSADIILRKDKTEIRRNAQIKKIASAIKKILRKYDIVKAGIFGSYARGEQKKNSDIDIIVYPKKPLGFKFAEMKFEIEKKLKNKTDIITYKSINPIMKNNILNEELKIL